LPLPRIYSTDRGRVLIGCRRRGGRAIIEVHDTGLGIPENQLTTIFQEFRRLDPCVAGALASASRSYIVWQPSSATALWCDRASAKDRALE
jgi:hypothetical protein